MYLIITLWSNGTMTHHFSLFSVSIIYIYLYNQIDQETMLSFVLWKTVISYIPKCTFFTEMPWWKFQC